MRRNYTIALIAVIAAVCGVGIAYAALSTTLTITTNKVTQNALTWNVAFTTGTVNATVGGTGDAGRSCGAATVTANAVTVADTSLSKPGDSCTYALTIKNTGGIDAKLGSLVPTKPTESGVTCTVTSATTSVGASMVCGNLTYKITTDAAGSSPLKTNTTIAKTSGSQAVYLIVSYTGTELNTSAVTQTGGKFTFTYNQA